MTPSHQHLSTNTVTHHHLTTHPIQHHQTKSKCASILNGNSSSETFSFSTPCYARSMIVFTGISTKYWIYFTLP
ncbi:hypothetical protein PCANC_24716 [Puccinia coronata f. sp. avenae]|uniref:Uncharacterized protein n=1 Tax=Puccinia coronata f. sp. avenae TaxID=200324 RepID=A0A2N5TPV5_9BASI|nr:hypothetical protein PCANC_24716 [Puccinia coronata f. sp. avenae]